MRRLWKWLLISLYLSFFSVRFFADDIRYGRIGNRVEIYKCPPKYKGHKFSIAETLKIVRL